MDEQLVELVKVAKVDTPQAVKRQVHFSDDGTADLEHLPFLILHGPLGIPT